MADDIQIKGAAGDAGTGAAKTPAQGTGAAQSPAPATAAPVQGTTSAQGAPPTPPKPLKAGSISLDDEAVMSDQQMMAPPEKYSVPQMVKDKFPDLMKLIKETESMNDEERDYWFQILPIMSEDQISKFRDILLNEKQQLARLDTEYEQELSKLNEKHMIELREFETKEKRKALAGAEKKAEVEEKEAEADLLKRLSSI